MGGGWEEVEADICRIVQMVKNYYCDTFKDQGKKKKKSHLNNPKNDNSLGLCIYRGTIYSTY